MQKDDMYLKSFEFSKHAKSRKESLNRNGQQFTNINKTNNYLLHQTIVNINKTRNIPVLFVEETREKH